jgi:glucose-6-phosphate dehydrogenase assembly protein OpcA
MQMYNDELFGTILTPPTCESKNVLKASFFTLIAVVKGAEQAERCQKFVHLISKKFPCKIIFLGIDSEAHDTLIQHKLTSKIVGDEKNAIACDVVILTASQDQMSKIPFFIIPEILADLPSFLLIGHDPAEVKPLVDQLEPFVSRIVFDIPRLRNIGSFADYLLSLPSRQKYVDLNWARTKPWREALFRTFNSREALSLLSSCNRIEIRYSHRPEPNHNPDTQALLLQAWVANRLGWQLTSAEDSADHITLHYTRGTKDVIIILSPTDSSIIEEGRIVSIEVMGDRDVHFLLCHERDDRHIMVHASSEDRCEMPYALFVGSFQQGRAILSEIFLQAGSEHYLPTIELLSSSAWRHNRDTATLTP